MIAHQLIESVYIRKEKVYASFVESKIVIQIVDNQFCCCRMQSKRLTLAGMYVIKIICSDGKCVLDEISSIPSTTLAEDDFGAAFVFLNLLLVDGGELRVA